MTVLIAAARKHDATREIAARIGTRLTERGIDVEVKSLEQVAELGGYDAFVIGSVIYLGNWLKQAYRFLDAHLVELTQRPTWLFASGSILAVRERLDRRQPAHRGRPERPAGRIL